MSISGIIPKPVFDFDTIMWLELERFFYVVDDYGLVDITHFHSLFISRHSSILLQTINGSIENQVQVFDLVVAYLFAMVSPE